MPHAGHTLPDDEADLSGPAALICQAGTRCRSPTMRKLCRHRDQGKNGQGWGKNPAQSAQCTTWDADHVEPSGSQSTPSFVCHRPRPYSQIQPCVAFRKVTLPTPPPLKPAATVAGTGAQPEPPSIVL